MLRLLGRSAARRAAHACYRQPHIGRLAGGSSRPIGGSLTIRAFSTAARDPHAVLGLSVGATEAEVKRAYYELAKQTHPDALGEDADDAGFLEVADAFAMLMEAAAARPQAGQAGPYGSRTGARAAAGRSAAATAARRGAKPPTLGEILVARLQDEPGAAALVWGDVKERRCEVTARMMDALFKAIAKHRPGSEGMRDALAMLRDATAAELLSPGVRATALVSLLTWCKEDELEVTFEVVDEVRDSDRTPEVLAALNAAFSYYGRS